MDLSGLVQGTLMEALKAGTEFQKLAEAQKPAWLRTALAHNLTDEIRKLRTQKQDIRRECSLDEALDASSARLEAWLASEESSPSQKAIHNEETARLNAALGRLAQDRRKAVQLHLQRRTLQEMAQVMGKTKLAVAQLVSRGIKDLRRLLGPDEGGTKP